MSADRELLELAAKAAGIEGSYVENAERTTSDGEPVDDFTGIQRNAPDDYPWRKMEITYGAYDWNPLDDDGDALRLAVKLQLDVLTHGAWDSTGTAPAVIVTDGSDKNYEVEPHGDDACAATRLAIVKVAAAIGKAMP